MKRIKIGVAVVMLLVAMYTLVSYGIFFIKKSSIDDEIQGVALSNISPNEERSMVVVQHVSAQDEDVDMPCPHIMPDNVNQDFLVSNDTSAVSSLINSFVVQEDLQPVFFIEGMQEKKMRADEYSFLTMPLPQDYQIDAENYRTLDILIGKDLRAFANLLASSNNNVLSKEACKSCAIYALLKKIKKHHPLTFDDIESLRSSLLNLYAFLENMKKLSNKVKMPISPEQEEALLDLYRSQAIKNQLKLQARKNATAAALKKLQSIQYNH